MDQIKALLREMRDDDYVRFRYGKRIDAALKALDGQAGVNAQALEKHLVEMLELVRGKKGGGAQATAPKSKRPPSKAKEAAVAHV